MGLFTDSETTIQAGQTALRIISGGFIVSAAVSYTHLEGLRSAVAEKLKRDNGLDYEMTDVIVTVGANQAVSIAMTALLDPGDEVLVPNPSWLHYFYCADLVLSLIHICNRFL